MFLQLNRFTLKDKFFESISITSPKNTSPRHCTIFEMETKKKKKKKKEDSWLLNLKTLGKGKKKMTSFA